MKLKNLKGILIGNVKLATIDDNGWEKQVDNIYSWYDVEEKEHYTIIWLGW